MPGAAGAGAGPAMKKTITIVVIVGLAAFAVSLGVHWYRGQGRPDEAPPSHPGPPKRFVNPRALSPDDFFAVGTIASGQGAIFDTSNLKLATVTIGSDVLRGDICLIGGVPAAVFCFNEVHLDRRVRFMGRLPVIIVSKGSIVVKTLLSVSGPDAQGKTGGKGICGGHDGGSAGADGRGPGGGSAGRGAAGGSYGGRGANGTEGKAARTYGQSPIFRLQGGSGGGGGADGGGAGGGAIQLLAGKAIEIASNGSIQADGGSGAGNIVGGGGGGSGGAILLKAPRIAIGGQVLARGGKADGGDHAGGAGGGGRIAIYFTGTLEGKLPTPGQHVAGGRADRSERRGRAGTVVPMASAAWWTFDKLQTEGTGKKVAVDSMGQSHGVLWELDESALVDGVCGKGLQLDGEIGYVEVSSSRDPIRHLGRRSMTLALWVRTEGLADKAVLVGKGMPMVQGGEMLAQWMQGGYGKRFVIQKRGKRIVFAVEQGTTRSTVGVAAEKVLTGEWVHLAAVRDAEARMLRIFVNGRKLAEAPDSTIDVSSQLFNLYLGAGEDGSIKNFVRAAIDDVRVFTVALGADALTGLIRHSLAGGGVAALGPAGGAGESETWIDPSLSDKDRKAVERARDRYKPR